MNISYLLPIVLLLPFVLLAIDRLAKSAKVKRVKITPIRIVHTARGKVCQVWYNGRWVTRQSVDRVKIRRI